MDLHSDERFMSADSRIVELTSLLYGHTYSLNYLHHDISMDTNLTGTKIIIPKGMPLNN
jgi:hypothetical protein